MSKGLSLVVTLLALIAFGSLASAQTTTKCSVTFSGGAGNFAFKYCVTKNGNIARMETPLTFQHLSTTNPSEGYGICDLDTHTSYYDYAGGGATSNWDPPVFLSLPPAPVVIERRTSDGRWTLTQTFSASGADTSFQVKMELLNRDPSKTKKANLVRFANVNIDGNASNIFQVTPFSVVAGSTLAGSPGIQLRDVGKADNTPLGLTKPNGPNPCNPTANSKAPTINSDGGEELLYVRTVPNNGTKTATILYRPF